MRERSKSILRAGALLCSTLLLLGACGGDRGTGSSTSAQAGTTGTTRATTTTSPFEFTERIELSGSGDDVVDLEIPGGEPAILIISYRGSGNFAVWTNDSYGDQLDLVVNTIGTYSGVRPINLAEGEEVSFLEITAEGSWAITAAPLFYADTIPASGDYSGRGDDVLLDLESTGASRATITHSGTDNFAIWVYGDETDLIVNEIGRYQGTVLVPAGTILWDITADGTWAISLDR